MFLVPKSLKLAVIWEADETEYIVDRFTPPIHHFPPLSSCLSRCMHIRTQFSFSFSHLEKKIIACLLLFHPILHAFLLIVVVITTFFFYRSSFSLTCV